jgi:rhamnogalacturonyl hydrolase YesR
MKIETSIKKLMEYIETENYRGYDPYDALKSPLFKLPVFRSNKVMRFGVQQVSKRSFFNLRPFLAIPKGMNPVTLGLCIQAYSYLSQVDKDTSDTYIQRIESLLNDLEKMISRGYSGACWGYDFDWQARNATIPATMPTIVATGIITNALFSAYSITGSERALALCKSAGNFVLNDLQRIYDGELFCFSYSPPGKQQVLNASMKGARLLAQVYSVTFDSKLKELAKNAVSFVVNKQRRDGSWPYAATGSATWTDNYHTGYILDCLDEYIKHTGDRDFDKSLKNGYSYYKSNFFDDHSIPKFYNNRIYPVDCTAAGQSLLTLARFGDTDLASNVANWMIAHMQDSDGHFYYHKTKYLLQKTSFMRWSNAWMFAGLAYLLFILSD